MWIKLCGNTSLSDARLCAAGGADALGFIFARDSKRYIPPQQAASICAALSFEFPAVERVGVFTNGDAKEIAAIANACALTGVQLQSQQTQQEARKLRAAAPHLVLIAAFPWASQQDFRHRLAANNEDDDRPALFDRFLVDSPSAHNTGGTGKPFLWSEAAGCFAVAASRGLPAIAAGGLNAENVTAAVTFLNPFGVDAVSSLESRPGTKDPERVSAFLTATRAASPEPEASSQKLKAKS